jgi:hypothetical protein
MTMDARARTMGSSNGFALPNRLNEATNSLSQGYPDELRDSTTISYDDRRPFIPRSNAFLPSITECDRNESNKRQIEKQLATCLSTLINGPDVFDGNEKSDILEKMKICAETLANLTNSLIGSADGPVCLLQSVEGFENDVQQQVSENRTDAVVKIPTRRKKTRH